MIKITKNEASALASKELALQHNIRRSINIVSQYYRDLLEAQEIWAKLLTEYVDRGLMPPCVQRTNLAVRLTKLIELFADITKLINQLEKPTTAPDDLETMQKEALIEKHIQFKDDNRRATGLLRAINDAFITTIN